MICRSTVRRFDGDASTSLHTAIVVHGAIGLRFIAFVVLDKGTGRYAVRNKAPAFWIGWVPQEHVRNETSSAAEIDAALANPDHVPLLVLPAFVQAQGYVTNEGHAFPVVISKGTPMVLAIRVERIVAGTHGQLTFGWEDPPCR